MTSSAVPDHRPDRLGPTRRRVLAHLQELPDPTSTEVLADSLALHPNTVRFHLDGLLAANLVRRVVEHRGVQGRPRVLFTAAPTVPPVTDHPYRSLVQAILGYLRDNDSPDNPIAERIGVDPVLVRVALIVLILSGGLGIGLYAWGTVLTRGPSGTRPIDSVLPTFTTWSSLAQKAAVVQKQKELKRIERKLDARLSQLQDVRHAPLGEITLIHSPALRLDRKSVV